MPEQIENERKLLLRRLPRVNYNDLFDNVFHVTQYYLEDNTRYRKFVNFKTNDVSYERVKKESTDDSAARIEVLDHIDYSEYAKGAKQAVKKIIKKRYSKQFEDYKLEIDHFINIDLVIAEIEITSEEKNQTITNALYNITLPDYVNDEVLMEVTEYNQFKNENLAVMLA